MGDGLCLAREIGLYANERQLMDCFEREALLKIKLAIIRHGS